MDGSQEQEKRHMVKVNSMIQESVEYEWPSTNELGNRFRHAEGARRFDWTDL